MEAAQQVRSKKSGKPRKTENLREDVIRRLLDDLAGDRRALQGLILWAQGVQGNREGPLTDLIEYLTGSVDDV